LLLEPNKKLREVLFGTQLLNYLEIGGGLELLKNEIAYFKYEYPNSPYNNIIANYRAAIYTRKSQLSVTKKFQLTPIVIIDSNGLIQYLSFAGYPFLKDSIVFAEVWATWCGPCLSEMQYNFPVDKEKWVNEIFKMNLSGYHILAGEALQSLLTKDFGFGESLMAIPRYFIIRKGKIVILDAFRPSEFEKLKNQLKEISDFKN
jgi:thiol-disulfide isomerase/thioredoxin